MMKSAMTRYKTAISGNDNFRGFRYATDTAEDNRGSQNDQSDTDIVLIPAPCRFGGIGDGIRGLYGFKYKAETEKSGLRANKTPSHFLSQALSYVVGRTAAEVVVVSPGL